MICEGSPKGTFAVITQKCNKTANINVKKLQFIHKLTASDTVLDVSLAVNLCIQTAVFYIYLCRLHKWMVPYDSIHDVLILPSCNFGKGCIPVLVLRQRMR